MRALWLILCCWPMLAQGAVQLAVEGVPENLQQAVLQGVALSQYAKREVSAAQVRRLYAQAPEQARKALEPYGYFAATVSGRLQQTGADWQVVLQVDAGVPVRVQAVDIKLDPAAASLPRVREALAAFAPGVGEVLDQGRYTASRDAIGAALVADGYLDARLVTHRVAVHRAEQRAQVQLSWDVGRRYRFGEVRFEGSQFEPGYLQRYVPFAAGDWFSQGALLALQQALTGADYFAVVNVMPQFEQAHDGRIDIGVELVPAKRSVYTGGPFVGSDVGVGMRVAVQRRWVNRKGHKWQADLIAAQRLKSLSSWYTIPMPGPWQRSLKLGGLYRDIDTDSAQSETLELVGNETRQWHGWTRILGVHVLRGTFTVGRRGDEPEDTPGVEHGRSTMVFAEASLLKKHADDPSFVQHGWSLLLSARSTAGSLLSDTRFSQLLVDAKWIHAFDPQNRLLLRGSAGLGSSGDFSQLPPPLRFFAGGSRSVRGYGFQALGPRNAHDRVVGGANLLVASAEVEHYFTPTWGMAAFVDAGNAFQAHDFRPRLGAGLGLRWNSPVGMIRVDLGVPLRNEHHSGVQLHLVIGPDL